MSVLWTTVMNRHQLLKEGIDYFRFNLHVCICALSILVESCMFAFVHTFVCSEGWYVKLWPHTLSWSFWYMLAAYYLCAVFIIIQLLKLKCLSVRLNFQSVTASMVLGSPCFSKCGVIETWQRGHKGEARRLFSSHAFLYYSNSHTLRSSEQPHTSKVISRPT